MEIKREEDIEKVEHFSEIDLVGMIYSSEENVEKLEFLLDLNLVFHSYNAEDKILFIASGNSDENSLDVYRIDIKSEEAELIYTHNYGDKWGSWISFHGSHDGRSVAAAFYDSKKVYLNIFKDKESVYKSETDIDEAVIDSFASVLHPDKKHYFFWMEDKKKVEIFNFERSEVVKSIPCNHLMAMNISPNGDSLFIATYRSLINQYNLPEAKVVDKLESGFSFYNWGPTGFQINENGNLAVSIHIEERIFCDIQEQVTDRDSHLVLWSKDRGDRWIPKDVYRFEEYITDLDYPFDFKSFGYKILWAGYVRDNDYENKHIMVMEFPSEKKVFYPVKYISDNLFFSEDGRVIYDNDDIYSKTGIDISSDFQFEESGKEIISPDFRKREFIQYEYEEDYRVCIDHNSKKLDLTGKAIKDLSFLKDITFIETLILDDSDVVDITDIKVLKNLKCLSLKKTIIYDFVPVGSLINLEELHISDFASCNMDFLGGLVNLKKLSLTDSLISDISVIENLTSLCELNISGTKVNNIIALTNLKLKSIDISGTSVTDISALSEMESLETIIADYTKIPFLEISDKWKNLKKLDIKGASFDPESLNKLAQLEWLSLRGKDNKDFSFISKMKGLKGLNVGFTSFNNLDLLSNCRELELLNISDTPVKDGLEKISESLTQLSIDGRQFDDLSPLGKFKNLEKLNIGIESAETFEESVKSLTNLTHLTISSRKDNDKLSSCGFLSSLKKLEVLSLNLNVIDDLTPVTHLENLKNLSLWVGTIKEHAHLKDLTKLESLKINYTNHPNNSVPDIISGLKSLEQLDIEAGCFETNDFLGGLTNLKSLKMNGYKGWDLGFIKNMDLKDLELSNALDLEDIEDLGYAKDLRRLKIFHSTVSDFEPVFQLKRLRSFQIRTEALFDLDQFKNFESLREIQIPGSNYKSIIDLPEMDTVRSFSINSFKGDGIEGIEKLKGLRNLGVHHCKLKNFPDLGDNRLETLKMTEVVLENSSSMAKLQSLRELKLDYPLIDNYHWLCEMKYLQDFYLSTLWNKEPDELKGIELVFDCDNLQHISLSSRLIKEITSDKFFKNLSYCWFDLYNLSKISPLQGEAEYLSKLNIGSSEIEDFSFLNKMPNLKELSVRGSKFKDLLPVSEMRNLRTLEIYGSGVTDLTPIKNCKSLRTIDISKSKIKDISAISNLTYLDRFDAQGCTIESYEPLRNLEFISWMYINPPLNKDIDPFKGKKYLSTLSLSEGKVKSIDVLFPLILKGNLTSLFMHGLEIIDALPEGLEFERYEFIENIKKYVKKNPGFMEEIQ